MGGWVSAHSPLAKQPAQAKQPAHKYEGRDRERVRQFLATANLSYAADGLFSAGLTCLKDFSVHPMFLQESTLAHAGIVKVRLFLFLFCA